MSFNTVMNPQMKKSAVTTIRPNLRFDAGSFTAESGELVDIEDGIRGREAIAHQ